MSVAIVTGSAGLVGAAAVRLFAEKGLDVIGVDNDMRKTFFGDEASTAWNRDLLQKPSTGTSTRVSISATRRRSTSSSAVSVVTLR